MRIELLSAGLSGDCFVAVYVRLRVECALVGDDDAAAATRCDDVDHIWHLNLTLTWFDHADDVNDDDDDDDEYVLLLAFCVAIFGRSSAANNIGRKNKASK